MSLFCTILTRHKETTLLVQLMVLCIHNLLDTKSYHNGTTQSTDILQLNYNN